MNYDIYFGQDDIWAVVPAEDGPYTEAQAQAECDERNSVLGIGWPPEPDMDDSVALRRFVLVDGYSLLGSDEEMTEEEAAALNSKKAVRGESARWIPFVGGVA